jgi:ATP adenylyltransferase
MKHLHAPWRIAYIRSAPRARGCLFCRVAAARRDAHHLLLHRGRAGFTLMNRFPYNPGHLLVAPYAHKGRLSELTEPEMLELLTEAREMEALLDRVLKPHGYNLGINVGRTAGQGVLGHLHLHVVPRWDGDSNFMPVLADTKVVPDALADLYARLRAAL